jgi:hypothetical protein
LEDTYVKTRTVFVLLLASCIFFSQVDAAVPFREVTSNGHDVIRLAVDGLPALSNPAYSATDLVIGNSKNLTLTSANADVFATPISGVNFVSVNYTVCGFFCDTEDWPPFLVGEALPAEVPVGSTLFMGIDDNGDGLPQREEARCQVLVQADVPTQCLIEMPEVQIGFLPLPVRYWLFVQPPAGQANVSLSLHHAALTSAQTPIVTGPGHAAAGATLPLRIANSVYPSPLPQRYYAVASVTTGEGENAVPFAVTTVPGSNDISFSALSGGRLIQDDSPYPYEWLAWLSAAPGASLHHVFFDIPPTMDGSYASVNFRVDHIPNDVDIYLVRADFPAQSSAATVDAAPAPDATVVHWDPATAPYGAMHQLAAGRWYVVVENRSSSYITFSVALGDSHVGDALWKNRFGVGATPLIAPGFYYNHLRSGHGITVSQAGGQQVVNWFTYLEDGAPHWYQAQANAPATNSGWWQAPLYRADWDGAKAHLTQVGDITLTPIANNEFMFTWHLEGRSGSERFTQLGRTACPSFNGEATNFTGAWYAPTLSGYGMDVLAMPEQQFVAFYFYDDLGIARWGVGGSGPFAASSTLSLTQTSGFCPSCTYTSVTSQPLGTVDVAYTDAKSGSISSSVQLNPPLSGSWNYTRPLVRLTGSPACAQ